ncbi:hypothetical protein ACHQM5_028009 [Ranunculus cassubicifolius]
MDCCNSSIITTTLPITVKNNHRRTPQDSFARVVFSTNSTLQSQNLRKAFVTPQSERRIYARRKTESLIVSVANAQDRGSKYSGVGTPLQPSSPEGIFLSGVLRNQRHLFHFAVSEQLDQLASDRDGAVALKTQDTSTMESLLHKRIAEMKEKECQIAVEDVMYMSIVQKFSEVEVPMVPKLSECINGNKLQIWPSKCRELESVHSLEVQEMIKEHLATILRMRERSSLRDGSATTTIDRLHLGRIYAASVMYGYFLKSAHFRRQMDMSLARTQEVVQSLGERSFLSLGESFPYGLQNLAALGQSPDTELASLHLESLRCDTKRENLKSYVMGFDAEALQRSAKLKTEEAVNVIERHTWALFGDDNTCELESDNEIIITFPSLERLVLEAVAFGSFLWDVERSVDSTYRLTEN